MTAELPGRGLKARVAGHRRMALSGTWELAETAPGAAATPDALAARPLEWMPFQGPATAAAALRAVGRWSLDQHRDFDAPDWWFRHRFAATPASAGRDVLRLDGLATLADCWLDGEHLLHSENMFEAHAVDLDQRLRRGGEHQLLIRCASLSAALEHRRPRPAWRTRLVAHQQLRWHRTTLLGRMPGWSPPVAPVGPWRAIELEHQRDVAVIEASLRPRVTGTGGEVEIVAQLAPLGGRRITAATLVVGDTRGALGIAERDGVVEARGTVRLANVARWWPHTHGGQPRYACHLSLELGTSVEIELGKVGFRTIEVDDRDGGFGLRVNDVPVFCRGACWTTTDIAVLHGSADSYRADLALAREAGMNMLRVGGTMVYESDDFYEMCDALGILVWQDFMFANMDYPADDPAFAAGVREEATQLFRRLDGRPSLAVLCGGSEVEQQAAMLGLPRERWRNRLFGERLPELCHERRPDVPYLPSTPTGGTLPFQADAGVTHYYGVGAYRRPLDDARRAGVRFASECLGFSNVPEPEAVDALLASGEAPAHHPRWKERVPRDAGAGWDFEDVRDHYLEQLFGVEPGSVRYADPNRYLELGRVVTGEVMAAVLGEWRSSRSTCRGALVWFYRDLWPGAGWGIIDALGRPKAAYHYLRRVCQAVGAHITDEGVNGLRLHGWNETATALAADLRVTLYRDWEVPVASGCATWELPARGTVEQHLDGLFEGFLDLSYAYRFGPPGHHLVAAELRDRSTGEVVAEAFHCPLGLPRDRDAALGLEARAAEDAAGWSLTVRSRRFAHAVAVEVDGFTAADAYFHLAPGGERSIRLKSDGGATVPAGWVRAANGAAPTRIVVPR